MKPVSEYPRETLRALLRGVEKCAYESSQREMHLHDRLQHAADVLNGRWGTFDRARLGQHLDEQLEIYARMETAWANKEIIPTENDRATGEVRP